MPVYFIQEANNHKGPIKIGWAIDPEYRLKEFQTGAPVILTILNTLDCERGQELALHYHFAHLRLHGEWFKATKELRQFVRNPSWVIDRRPIKEVVERRPCAGFSGETKLSPCDFPAIEGSDYCRYCDKKTPKGMPKMYLLYLERKSRTQRCEGITTQGDRCKRWAVGATYCEHHRIPETAP